MEQFEFYYDDELIEINNLSDLKEFIENNSRKPLERLVKTADGYLIDLDTCSEYYHVEHGRNQGIYKGNDDLVYCDDIGEYVHEDSVYKIVYTNYSRGDYEYWYDYDSAYYCHDIDECVSDNCNLYYAEDTEGWYYSNDDLYLHSDDCWRTYEEEQYTRSYYNGGVKFVKFDNTPHLVGIEIEKEDLEVKQSMYISEFESKFEKFRLESDGSLDDESGFELVTPAFSFDVPKIIDYLKETVIEYVNADYSNRCGGHINLSIDGLTPKGMFNSISGYMPLLYALYPNRVGVDYCKGKPKHDMITDDEKYQAVRIHSNRIEFRIFPAVQDIKNLEFRLNLIKFMVDNPVTDELEAYVNVTTRLSEYLQSTVYTDKDRYNSLLSRFKKYTRQFEGIEI